MPNISVSNSPPTSFASTRNMKMLPDFCNQPPNDLEPPPPPPSLTKKNKALFIIKNALFKSSSNTLRLAFWLAFAIVLNVVIIVFFFRDHPSGSSSSSSSNEQIFEDPVVRHSRYIEAPLFLRQHSIQTPVGEKHKNTQDFVAPVVDQNQHLQYFEAPPVGALGIEPPIVLQHIIEAPIIEQPQRIEVPAVEQRQKPQKIAVEQNFQPQKTETSFVEQHQQPQNVESPVVEEYKNQQSIEPSPAEGNHYCKSGKVFVYDLPPIFNKEFLNTCQELDPWSSRCNAVSNGGFGPKATGLESVVPRKLEPAWYWTDMYSAEVIYHTRMLKYNCRTENPEEATAFYMPFYVGLAVGKYLWENYTSKDRDRHGEMLLDWVKDQPSWKRFNGSDHFLVFGRLTWDFRRQTNKDSEWGSSFMYMPLMKNVLRVSVERNTWDPLEISVPYPTAFHPRSESDISGWQNHIRTRNRSSLFCFVGATRNKIKNDFRGILMNYCKNESETCRVVDCSVTSCYDGAPAILEAFLDSDFCLQPKGDGYTRRSFFDCMLAGSIPVYFWRKSFEEQYQWHLPLTGKSSSVFIDKNEVRNETAIIRKLLEAYSREEIKMMRETVIDMVPRFVYAMSSEGFGKNGSSKDAFDITVEGVLRKFQQQRRRQRR